MAKFISVRDEPSEPIDFPPLYPWKPIHKFSEIDIKPNTIVLCDIDDTLLHHPYLNNAWQEIITAFFVTKHHYITDVYDAAVGAKNAEAYFAETFTYIPIRHTDRDGFFELGSRAKKLIFVTARPPDTVDFTRDNLRSIGVDPDSYEIRFSGCRPKGEYIQAEIDLNPYDSVIFIDDQTRNLENVYSFVLHPSLELYKFEHVAKNPYTYYPFPRGFNRKYRFNGIDLEIDPTYNNETK